MNYDISFDFDETTKKFFTELKTFKPLKKEEEKALMKRYKTFNDIKARNTLITSNLKYACKLAYSYRDRGISLSDLVSEATSGLIESIDKFDTTQDVKLISYSKWWIMQKMQSAIEKNNKMPESDLPDDNMMDDECSNSDDEITTTSTNSTNDTFSYEIDTDIEEDSKNEMLAQLFNVLDERECDMLNMYFGRLYGSSFTLDEIGEKYSLTKERVRQIIESALRKVRSEAILSDSVYLSRG